MRAVYEGVDERLGITVALKETLSTNEQLRRQFDREARMLARLHHPALPRVSDYFREGERVFLVMQFIEGVDLAAIIAQQPGPFPRNQVIAWADQIMDALIYLHSLDRQIIHRDIKPHNLKLTSSGKIALLDFGLAKAESPNGTDESEHSIPGYTRRYAPLEQIQDEGTTPQSDIYALGATLYHLLTGIKPTDALERAAALVNSQSDPLRRAHEINPAVGEELSAILARAMAQDPQQRYASAMDFREALRRVGRVPNVESKHKPELYHEDSAAGVSLTLASPLLQETMRIESGTRVTPAAVVIVLVLLTVVAGLLWSLTRTLFDLPDIPPAASSNRPASPSRQPKQIL